MVQDQGASAADRGDRWPLCLVCWDSISKGELPTDQTKSVPSASNPSSLTKSSETSNACMSSTRIVWINGICRISSTVRCAIARTSTSSFSRRMSLCGWYNFFSLSLSYWRGYLVFVSHIWLTMFMTLMIDTLEIPPIQAYFDASFSLRRNPSVRLNSFKPKP